VFPVLQGGRIGVGEQLKGTLRKWNDDRGFGFIEPEGGGEDVFAHISVFAIDDGRRPEVGEPVLYELDTTTRRARASTVRFTRLRIPKPSRIADAFALVAIAVFLAWLWGGIPLGPIFGAYLGMSILTYAFYWVDKRRAESGHWRLAETTLHVMEALGGWPGALVAQLALRHKVRKPDYQRVFWTIVAIHVVAGAYWVLTSAR
jgi:uncharacterized membrane protein YsdA (DUF1294 family)/cold shock CspA family protein